jgi:hypothetical protein
MVVCLDRRGTGPLGAAPKKKTKTKSSCMMQHTEKQSPLLCISSTYSTLHNLEATLAALAAWSCRYRLPCNSSHASRLSRSVIHSRTMASLLVIIFVVELAAAVVNSIGAATINNLVSGLFSVYPQYYLGPHDGVCGLADMLLIPRSYGSSTSRPRWAPRSRSATNASSNNVTSRCDMT